MKLQHEAGNPPLIASCDYKLPELCQHPILHDVEITSSVVSAYWDADGTDLMENRAKVARKNIANGNSATIKAYKNRDSRVKWNGVWRVSTKSRLSFL